MAPTAEPLVTADPEIPGNVKYTLDADADYAVKAKVLGQEINLSTTDGTVDTADWAIGKMLDGFTAIWKDADSFTNKAIDMTYTLGTGARVDISKESGSTNALSATLFGICDAFDGAYNVNVYRDGGNSDNPSGDGQYTGSYSTGGYYIEGNEKSSWKNKFTIRFAENAPVQEENGNQTISYEIDYLTFTQNWQEETVVSVDKDASDNIKVTVNSTAAGSETITAERNGNKFVIKKDADGYSISVPEAYQSKLQIAAKAPEAAPAE